MRKNFTHKLLLTVKKVSRIRKAFENGSSTNIKFLKTLLSKIIYSGGFNTLNLKNTAEKVYEIANIVKD